jgi:hypothetical protein
VKVKLTKKFAAMLCGVDLSRAHEGDVLDIAPRDAGILLASEWALPADETEDTGEHRAPKVVSMPLPMENAADAAPRKRRA